MFVRTDLLDIYLDYFQDSHFVRCILPNDEKNDAKFEENLVSKQLITSSTISYAKFIRFGYPKRIELQKMVDECKWLEKKLNIECAQRLTFYSKVLLYIGFKLKDFKMGNNAIFFRLSKFNLLERFFSDLAENKEEGEDEGLKNTLSVSESLHLNGKREPK